jgi:hypothetical protein
MVYCPGIYLPIVRRFLQMGSSVSNVLNCRALLQQGGRTTTLSTTLSPLHSTVSVLNVCTVLEAWHIDLIYFHSECTHAL